MSVSNRVALWAILPGMGILLYGIGSIFIYQPSIDARVSILSSIATSVTVLFLISERLRESARRKLDYLNKRALTPLFQFGRSAIQSSGWGEDKTITGCRDLLVHHGMFLRVRLYPKSLLSLLDEAKGSVQTYDKFFQEIITIGNNRIGPQQFNVWMVLVNQGLMDKGNYTNPMLDTHRTFLRG